MASLTDTTRRYRCLRLDLKTLMLNEFGHFHPSLREIIK